MRLIGPSKIFTSYCLRRVITSSIGVRGSGCRPSGLGLEFPSGLVEIDLLLTKLQRLPVLPKGLRLHPQNGRVELEGAIDIRNGQNQVIKARDVYHGDIEPKHMLRFI